MPKRFLYCGVAHTITPNVYRIAVVLSLTYWIGWVAPAGSYRELFVIVLLPPPSNVIEHEFSSSGKILDIDTRLSNPVFTFALKLCICGIDALRAFRCVGLISFYEGTCNFAHILDVTHFAILSHDFFCIARSCTDIPRTGVVCCESFFYVTTEHLEHIGKVSNPAVKVLKDIEPVHTQGGCGFRHQLHRPVSSCARSPRICSVCGFLSKNSHSQPWVNSILQGAIHQHIGVIGISTLGADERF